MESITNSPLFGIVLSIFAYELGIYVYSKIRSPLANPFLLATIFIITFLNVFHISFESYNVGGSMITLFLAPVTAALAVAIYNQRDTLKANLLPILAGCFAGSGVSIFSIFMLCKMFALSPDFKESLIPKSVSMPFALKISEQLGGILSITAAGVILTGIIGAVLAVPLIKLFRIKNPMVAGLAIGTSSHAVGTSKAVELGQTQGAISGLAIGICGIFTVLFCMFL